jgi:hypothetical protein
LQNPANPDPPNPSPKKSEAEERWYSNEPSKNGDKVDWPTSLAELFLFDPNFESCW